MANNFDWTQFAVGGAQRPDSFSGMDPRFSGALQQLFLSAPPDIQQQLRVGSGYRSIARQRELWNASDKSGKMVARPGGSQHNHGRAADLKYLNPAAKDWVHQNAKNFGLNFPMSYEPWHVELAGARGGHQHTAPQQQMAATAPTSAAQGMMSGAPTAAPQMFGSLIGATPVQTSPADPSFGLASMFMQQQAARQEQQKEEQHAEEARRLALFSADGLAGLYS